MTQDALAGMWGYLPTDVHLAAGPLYHSGPSGYCNNTLYVGGTVVIMESWDPHEFLRLVETHRVTTSFLTPAHFIRVLEVPAQERRRCDTGSLRHVIHAGAPCPRVVKQQIIEAFPTTEIWELYGASEGGATRVSSSEWSMHPGTVGRPWPGVESSPSATPSTRQVHAHRAKTASCTCVRATADSTTTTTSRRRPSRMVRRRLHGRRHRPPRRRGLPVPHRPSRRHGDPSRRERVPAGGRGGVVRAPRRGRLRGVRHPRRPRRRAPQGDGRGADRDRRGRAPRVSARRASIRTRCRA